VQETGEAADIPSVHFFRPLSALRLPALALAPNLYPISRSVAVGRLNAQRRYSLCGCSTKVERMVVPVDGGRGEGGRAVDGSR